MVRQVRVWFPRLTPQVFCWIIGWFNSTRMQLCMVFSQNLCTSLKKFHSVVNAFVFMYFKLWNSILFSNSFPLKQNVHLVSWSLNNRGFGNHYFVFWSVHILGRHFLLKLLTIILNTPFFLVFKLRWLTIWVSLMVYRIRPLFSVLLFAGEGEGFRIP